MVYRDGRSGTTAMFTRALSRFSAEWNETIGETDDASTFNTGHAALQAEYVRLNPNSLTYLSLGQAIEMHLSTAALVNRAGEVVYPNGTTVANASQAQTHTRFAVPLHIHRHVHTLALMHTRQHDRGSCARMHIRTRSCTHVNTAITAGRCVGGHARKHTHAHTHTRARAHACVQSCTHGCTLRYVGRYWTRRSGRHGQ